MPSLSPSRLDSLSFSSEHAASLARIAEMKGRQELFRQQRPELLDELRSRANIESTESSNRIEGIVTSRKRVEQIVEHAAEPNSRSEQELAGYRDALHMIHESALDMPFRPSVMLQLHQTIFRYQAAAGGRWKSTDNSIVELDERGEVVRVRFQPVAAVATPQAIDDLCTNFTRAIDEQKHDPMVLIPLAILDLTCIHPFTDGNGRISRLATLQLLYRSGYDVGRFISIERIIEQTKEGYYRALERSSQRWHESEHDPSPWLEHFWGVMIAAYDEFEQRVGKIDLARGAKSRRVREAVLRRALPFSISELQLDCPGISRETVRNVLRAMRDEGELELTGVGRGARWVRRS